MTVAAVDPMVLWYLARGSGLVLLGVLTVNLVLGILIQGGWHPRVWPRFAVQGLHRNLALLAVVLLAIHVVTIELDPYVPVGWWAALVPFVSPYRPIWLGLGTLSLDLLAAVVITSLLRAHLRPTLWRLTHWLAYLSWPVALLHSLGTGTDSRLGWVFVYEMICLGAVVATAMVRIARATSQDLLTRGVVMLAIAAAPVAVLIWSTTGPLQPGWAKKAGTPTAVISSGTGTGGAAGGGAFTAAFTGTLASAAGGTGQVVTISGSLLGGSGGTLRVSLDGQSTGDGGLAISGGSATYQPGNGGAAYQGSLVGVSGSMVELTMHRGSSSSAIRVELVLSQAGAGTQVSGSFYFGTAPSPAAGSQGDQG